MTRSLSSPIYLVILLGLLVLGCSLDESTPAPDSNTQPGELDSPIHDIRLTEWNLWSGMPTPVEVFLPVDDRDGWTYGWRAGGGRLEGSGPEVVWTTPLADSAWIESTLRRGGSEYVSRRWLALRNDPLTLQLELAPGEMYVGAVDVVALFNRPLPDQVRCVWGEDACAILSGTPMRQRWEVYARGPHRVWAAVEFAGRVARDTLTVVVPNVAPELVVGGYWEGPTPLGGEVQDMIRANDWNQDPLVLELLDLDGLEFVDTTWVAHDWVSDFQGHWGLNLRHTDGQPGWREVRFRVGDGVSYTESNLWFDFE